MTALPEEAVGPPAINAEDAGYHKSLKPRQLQMIAIAATISGPTWPRK